MNPTQPKFTLTNKYQLFDGKATNTILFFKLKKKFDPDPEVQVIVHNGVLVYEDPDGES